MRPTAKTYTLKITALIRENKDSVTICFKQPGLKKVHYLPGQYLTVMVTINGRKYRRPYSFSSSPGHDTTLNITVKRVHHGVVSNYLNDSINEGDMIEVLEPMGDFCFTKSPDTDHLVLWGAGSGITPLYSIMKSALSHPEVRITLVYVNKDVGNALFYSELLAFREKFGARLNLFTFFTACMPDQTDEYCYEGRIDAGHIGRLMHQVNGISPGSVHYICGPVGMKEAVKGFLRSQQLAEHRIFSEDFEYVADESVLEDVHTQTVTIELNGTPETVEVVRGKSILEAGLDRGLDLPYSCQNGTCTLCMGKLENGTVKMAGPEINLDELNTNEYLLCCTYPLSGDVKLVIN